MVKQLEQSGCKIIGAVMNKVPVKVGGYYQEYYHKYTNIMVNVAARTKLILK